MPKTFFLALASLFLFAGCFDSGEVRLLRPIGGCILGDQNYAVGANNIPAGDGCNTCVCGEGNRLICTQNTCAENNSTTLANPAAVKCEADGFKYETRKTEAGEAGFCVNAETKAECSDFAYFRGECALGDFVEKMRAPLAGVNGVGELEIIASENGAKITGNVSGLPLLAENESYLVWFVRVEPYTTLRIGALTESDEQNYEIQSETEKALLDFTRVVVTRQPAAALALELPKKVLEGTLEGIE